MKLDQSRIAALLPDIAVEVLPTVDSTNTEAKRRLRAGLTEPLLLAAEQQTAGRGRQGRSFYSPAETGIYMTLVIHPHAPLADTVSVTTRASVAVCRAIRRVTKLQPEIKWVNDLYLRGKKICGILAEAESDYAAGITNSLIIGVGINVTTADFPEELTEAASLAVAADRDLLIAAVAEELLRETARLGDRSYLEDYRRWSMVLGRQIVWTRNGESRIGRAVAIGEDGGLAVEAEDGSRHILQSGEISLRVRAE